jgi:hypothetical protein
VPCDPANAACPSGQRCVSEATGYFCETHEIVDAPPIDTPPDAGKLVFTYTAAIAECIDPRVPDPAKCKAIKGAAQLAVDQRDSVTLDPWDAFLRFDLDSAFGNGAIAKLELVLTATSGVDAPSPDSGVVYQVAAFTLAELSLVEPAKVGTAADRGPARRGREPPGDHLAAADLAREPRRLRVPRARDGQHQRRPVLEPHRPRSAAARDHAAVT